MARDFYTPFPFDLPSLPAVRRLGRSEYGLRARLAYYDLRIYAGLSYQYGRTMTVEDALAYAGDWDMTEDEAAGAVRLMADLRLIDAELLEEGLIGIPDVAERAVYLRKKAESGRQGGKTPGRSRHKAADGTPGEALA